MGRAQKQSPALLQATGTPLRDTGIGPVGDAPWGTHFCHFYETQADLLDLLVPYFSTGLKNNEFCMWVTSEPLGVADAKRALCQALPDLDDYVQRQQIEILDYSEWYTRGGSFDADSVLQGWVEKARSAVERGFDGLRLTGNTFWLEESDWKSFADYEAAVNSVIGQHRMIALCSYAMQKCGPHEFLDVVHNHQFALVKREGRWEVLASSALQGARQALADEKARGEERIRNLFDMMTEGFAVHELICDGDGKPYDYRFLEANPAFERLTGLRAADVEGRTVREVIPDIEPIWIERYGQVALTGEPQNFESFSQPLGRWYEVYAFRTQPMQFAVMFLDITGRKESEEVLRYHAALLANVGDAVMATDDRWVFTAWNPAAEALFGWKAEEVLGKPSADILSHVERDGRPLPREETRRALHDSGQFRAELTYYRRDGSPVEVDANSVAISNQQGQTIGYVTAARDITERKRAEEALHNLATFPTENPNPIIRVAKDGTVMFANESSRPLLELWGCEAGICLPPEQLRQVQEALSADKPVSAETACGDRTFLIIHAPIVGRDYVNIYGVDITERKRAEEALRESEEKYRTIVETAGEGIVIARPEGEYIYANQRMADLLGCSVDEILGKSSLDFVFPDQRPAVLQYRKDLRKVDTLRGELKFRRKDGSVLWTMYNASPIFNEIGEHIANLAMHTDVTERHMAEGELRQTKDYLEKLIDYANAPIIVWDPNFIITRFNSAFERLTGRPADEVVGRHLEILFPESERIASMEQIARTVKGEFWELIEIPILHESGEVRQVLWNSANITGPDGQTVVATIAQGTDITERKLVEEALRLRTDELANSNAELEQFAYVASHDLQEPLRMVSSYVQLLQRRYQGKLDQDADDFIGYATDGALRMQKLIQDLLAYSRVGTRGKNFQEVDLEAVLAEALDNLGLAIREKEATITHDPLPTVRGDGGQLTQVFQNLIDNAIKFRSEDRPKVHISANTEGNDFVCSVRDNGIGIPTEYQSRLFLLFQRLHTRQEYPGTGMGLAICKRIVERHGGRIWVESTPGEGSTFWFRIPVNLRSH